MAAHYLNQKNTVYTIGGLKPGQASQQMKAFVLKDSSLGVRVAIKRSSCSTCFQDEHKGRGCNLSNTNPKLDKFRHTWKSKRESHYKQLTSEKPLYTCDCGATHYTS